MSCMPELISIIDAHMDKYGVREAAFARTVNASPQTINAWRHRGIRALPSPALLRSVADITGRPYREILDAALTDAGYLP